MRCRNPAPAARANPPRLHSLETCATEIVIKDQGINQGLPLDQPVVVEFTPRKSGQLRYACAMDMIGGVIVVD